jgi:hypothetical protein
VQLNEENKFLGEMLWKVFDFITLGTFENNMEVPSEKPTNEKEIAPELPKKHVRQTLMQYSNGTIGIASDKPEDQPAQKNKN